MNSVPGSRFIAFRAATARSPGVSPVTSTSAGSGSGSAASVGSGSAASAGSGSATSAGSVALGASVGLGAQLTTDTPSVRTRNNTANLLAHMFEISSLLSCEKHQSQSRHSCDRSPHSGIAKSVVGLPVHTATRATTSKAKSPYRTTLPVTVSSLLASSSHRTG